MRAEIFNIFSSFPLVVAADAVIIVIFIVIVPDSNDMEPSDSKNRFAMIFEKSVWFPFASFLPCFSCALGSLWSRTTTVKLCACRGTTATTASTNTIRQLLNNSLCFQPHLKWLQIENMKNTVRQINTLQWAFNSVFNFHIAYFSGLIKKLAERKL